MARKKRDTESTTPRECWWKLSAKEAATHLKSWCDAVMAANSSAAARAYRYGCAYDGVTLTSVNGFAIDTTTLDDLADATNVPIIRNTLRRLVNTFIAKSFANDNPAPQMVSTDGSFQQRMSAELIDDVLMSEFELSQGQFANLHELNRHGGILATCATGKYWVFAFPGEGKVEAELDDGLTIGIVRTGMYGQILTLCRTIWRDPEWLCHRYPSKAAQIMDNCETVQSAQRYGDMRMGPASVQRNGNRLDPRRLVRIHQGWRAKLGKEMGREMFVLKDGSILEDNDWDHPGPPGKDWSFERELNGDRAVPLTQTIYRMFMREQEMLQDADRIERNTPGHVFLCAAGSGDAPSIKDQLQDTAGCQIVSVPGDPTKALHVVDNTGMKRNTVELLQIYNEGMHQVTGISANQTDGARQVGTTSGVHESLTASYYTENFADQERRLIQFRAVDQAQLFIWALQKVIKNKYSRWVGDARKRRLIEASDLDLDEDKYTLQIKPASEEKDSPKARLEKAEKLLQDPAGRFTGADLVEVWKTFDPQRAANKAYAIDEWVDEQCSRWLRATPDQVTAEGFYQSPTKWMRVPGLEAALSIVQANYLRARQDGAPRQRLALFERFADECVLLIDQEKQRDAQIQAQAAGKQAPALAPLQGAASGGQPPGPGPGSPPGPGPTG